MAELPDKRKSTTGSGMQAAVSTAALLRSLADPNVEIRRAAVQAALKMRDYRAVEPLLAVMHSKDASDRIDAARALASVTPRKECYPSVYATLRDPDPFIRAAVGRTLGKWGNRESIPWLIRALCDHEIEVRKVVAKALSRLGEVRWEKWLADSPQFGLKSGMTREQHLINTLTNDLRNAPSYQARACAAQAMPHFQNPQIMTELVRALSDDHAEVRKAATQALGQTKDRNAMKKLIHMLDDKDEGVRKAAIEALDKLDAIPE